MTNQNSIPDLSTTPASNLNWKGQSIVGSVQLVLNLDEAERNISSMLAANYDSIGGAATAGGTAADLTVTITEDWAAYARGLRLNLKAPSAATGAATLAVTVPTAGALGAKAIRRQGDSAIQANDWLANGHLELEYDDAYNSAAGAWVLLNPAAGGAFSDSTLRVQDNGDATKQLAFEVSGVTTGTTRTVTVPNENGTLGLNGGTSTDNNIPRYDGTLGKLQAGTGLAIDDTFNVTMSSPSGSEGTKYPAFFARAWVNFNGSGTVAINGSGNVSSITDNGVGDYTVNYTTNMPDANYAIAASADRPGAGTVPCIVGPRNTTPTYSTSACRIVVVNSADGATDPSVCGFVALR